VDAGLVWEIVGSIAGVAAIPIGVVIGISQLRQGRKNVSHPPNAETDGSEIVIREAARSNSSSLEQKPPGTTAAGQQVLPKYRSPDEASSLMNMRTVAGYRDWGQLRQLAVSNPVASVLLTWKTIHFLVYRHAYWGKASVYEDWETEFATIAMRLGADRRTAAVLEDLIDKRRMIETGKSVSPQDALEYIDSAETVCRLWLKDKADVREQYKFIESVK
jgi:hypothetical protein